MNTDRPVPPGVYDCCEGGCSPCVWDIYYEELDEWNAQQAVQKPATGEQQNKHSAKSGSDD